MLKLHTPIIAAALIMSISASAQTNVTTMTDGFYRVCNKGTQRYITVLDNRAQRQTVATSVDLTALHGMYGFDNVCDDPASVIYFQTLSGGAGYALQGQGADTYKMTGYPIKLRYYASTTGQVQQAWLASASAEGMTKYIGDPIQKLDDGIYEIETHIMEGDPKRTNSHWYIYKVQNSDNQWFGMTPEFTVGEDKWLSLYANFGYSAASKDMEFYTISVVDEKKGMAVIKKVEGTVNNASAIIAKVKGDTASDNRLTLANTTSSGISGNKLKGVYFDYPGYFYGIEFWGTREKYLSTNHENRTAYNASTMRVLGLTSSGKIGFVTSDKDYLVRNRTYLPVSASAPSELTIVTEEEYATGIEHVTADSDSKAGRPGTYTLSGTRVSRSSEMPSDLPSGLYIHNGKKVIK